jgi:hypothetical protein
MLPITNHRVLHVPHGLAIGAAVVGLVVALNWDRPQATATDLSLAAPSIVSMDEGAPANNEPKSPGREAPHGREMLPGFGPLVLPFAPSR